MATCLAQQTRSNVPSHQDADLAPAQSASTVHLCLRLSAILPAIVLTRNEVVVDGQGEGRAGCSAASGREAMGVWVSPHMTPGRANDWLRRASSSHNPRLRAPDKATSAQSLWSILWLSPSKQRSRCPRQFACHCLALGRLPDCCRMAAKCPWPAEWHCTPDPLANTAAFY